MPIDHDTLSAEHLGPLLRDDAELTVGTDIANLDRETARERGIAVVPTDMVLSAGDPGAGARMMNATPEMTWSLVLAAVRNLTREDRNLRAGNWQSGPGTVLAGRTLGLIGFGTIAKRVAHYANAFDMEVVAWSPSLTPERAQAGGARSADEDDVLRQADVLSIHVTLNDGTRGLLGARELALMKPEAYLVNTSRGPIVDEEALIDALHRGSIAGAALDVFDHEPLPLDHPFRSMENVTATPHLGYATRDTLAAMLGGMPATVARFFAQRKDRPIT